MGEEQVSVVTPESVDFSLEVAGLGSRFVALLLDEVVKGVAVLLLAGVAYLGNIVLREQGASRLWVDVLGGADIVLLAAVLGLYHIVFESAWRGRTPGKRLMGLRVVKDSGVPIGFWDALLRNLLRLVDALPSFYLVGIIAVFASPRHQRIGDLAASTLVIKERRLRQAAVPAPAAPPAMAALTPLPQLSYEEAEMVRSFLGRRGALTPAARQELAGRIAGLLRRRGITAADLGLPEAVTDEELLAVWRQRQET